MKLFETEATINFQTNEQKNHTILELGTHDRPGLLSIIAQVFLQCDIQLSSAKLITLGDQVEDIFFISTHAGHSLNKDEKARLQQELIISLTH